MRTPLTCAVRNLKDLAPGVRLAFDMKEAIREADVIMMLRVQLERQHEAPMAAGEYFRFFGLQLEHLTLARPEVIVMHPGPINRGPRTQFRMSRIVQRSAILNQVENGVAVRMAVLERILA